MSSNISTTNIRTDFPVAGQDNPSQGFRDNFSAIKLAFTTATSEISDLQANSANLTQTNDFGFNGGFIRTKIQNSGFVAQNSGGTTGELNYALANYYRVSLTDVVSTTTFFVTTWPQPTQGNVFAQVRVEVTNASTATTDVTFAAPGKTLLKETTTVLPHTSVIGEKTVWDLWSSDGGTTVFVKSIGTYGGYSA